MGWALGWLGLRVRLRVRARVRVRRRVRLRVRLRVRPAPMPLWECSICRWSCSTWLGVRGWVKGLGPARPR